MDFPTKLDVSDGVGERCTGGNQVLYGGVLVDCCVCKIFE